jgi:CRISPR/Cas system CMR-associated protein Cmr3 (group 5 of RAMP superfamily)
MKQLVEQYSTQLGTHKLNQIINNLKSRGKVFEDIFKLNAYLNTVSKVDQEGINSKLDYITEEEPSYA